jgi:hypothetical protein
MPVRKNEKGKLEYYRENYIKGEDWKNKIFSFWPYVGKPKRKKTKFRDIDIIDQRETNWYPDGFEYSYSSSSCSDSDSSVTKKPIEKEGKSCSPQDCPTCKEKDCPNSYDDFIEEGDMII